MTMRVGTVKIAEESDFRSFKEVCESNDGWKLEVSKQKTMVWTKANELSSFNMMKIRTVFDDVPAAVMYDVLHDPLFRKTWDRSMVEGNEICAINPNNDIGYYASEAVRIIPLNCAVNNLFLRTPLYCTFQTRCSCIHDTSVKVDPDMPERREDSRREKKRPVKKGVIRGISFLTGYLVRHIDDKSCQLTYISQSDPKGNLPAWAINKLTRILAPKVINRMYKAAKNYPTWKSKNRPELKPWLYPEQMMSTLPCYDPSDIQEFKLSASCESLEESAELQEEDFKDDDL